MPTEMYNEIELLKASMQGDTVAFEAIVNKYQSLICAITFSATADFEKSEELAQETFINAWKKLSQLKDMSKFRGWLCSIARNIIRNSFRSEKRDLLQKAVSLDQIHGDGVKVEEPSEEIITKEERAVVQQALKRIPERYREPLVLFYREQQSIKQVAEELDLSEKATKQRLYRGRKMLKEQVAVMVETTISRTGPSKAFTTAVIASVAGMAIKGSGAAAVAGNAAASSATGTATGVAAVMSGITAKIITTTAIVVIGVGAVVAYKHISNPSPGGVEAVVTDNHIDTPSPEPEFSQAGMIGQGQGDEQEKITEVTGQPSDETANLSAIEESKGGLESGKSVATPPEPEAKEVEFNFVPKGVLSGLITGENSSEPIKGVQLRICSSDYVEQYVTKTDVNGMYFFENIKKDGPYTIRLETIEYITPDPWKGPRENVQLAKSEQFVKHFQLRKGSKVIIDVIDEQGKPIKDVSLYAAYVSDDMGRGPKDNVRSDKNGNVIIGGLKPAEYMVSGWHRDYALAGQKVAFETFNETKTLVFEMKTGISIEGIAVCSDGLAAGGWEVYAKPVWWHSVHCAFDYPIDEDGLFILKHILPGDYHVGIDIPRSDGSSGLWSTKMALPPEDGFIELNIPKPSPHNRVSISGTLEFLNGEMERGIWITARDDSGNHGTTYIQKGQKDFSIDNLVPGLYKINLNLSGTTKVFRNVKAPSEGLVLKVKVPTKKKTSIRGQVLDKESGEPVTSFKARLSDGNYWREIEDSQGLFEINTSGSDCKRVQIQADGFTLKTSQEIFPDANEPAIIELGIGGAIEGIVLDEKRKPVQGAKISYRYSRSRDEEPNGKYITITDTNGLFIIEDIPEESTWQWFVISHPDYAPELKQIEVDEGYIADIEIVLQKGGAVEGYVYDAQGSPLPGTTLYFLDESQYSYWKENRGRLGSVTTDPNGFYRITGMPEKLCFGFRHEPDEQAGVVCTAILPKSGKSNFLDFGGQWYATGRLLQNGIPMPDIKVMVAGNKAGYETAFTAYARTDSEGRFTFWGVPSGCRFMSWSIPGMYGLNQWVEIGQFDFESGVDLDMDDFELQLAEVSIGISAENPDESLNQLDVYVQKYDEQMFYGRRVGQLSPRTDPKDPYIFQNIAPGTYEAIGRRSGYPTIHKAFEITQGQKQCDVDLWIPAGSASMSGKIIHSDAKEFQIPLMLRSINQEITMGIHPKTDGSYQINNLPSGDYIIGRASVALSRESTIKEFSLKSNETKKLDIEVDSFGKKYDGYLVVLVVTEEGLPLAGTKVWLEKGSETIYLLFDSDKGKSFAGNAGEYMLYAEYPGYEKIQQRVSIRSKEGLSMQEILKPVVITMSKQ